jgi:hypothetical protein
VWTCPALSRTVHPETEWETSSPFLITTYSALRLVLLPVSAPDTPGKRSRAGMRHSYRAGGRRDEYRQNGLQLLRPFLAGA